MDLPPPLPIDEQAALDALDSASNEELEALLRVKIPRDDRRRMQVLMCENNFGTITPERRAELTKMVEQGQHLTLRKAKAMALLAQRNR